MTGAAQLVCRAGLRIGAGLVSVACDAASLPVYAVANPAVITLELPTPADFAAALEEPRRNAVVVGPGNGVSAETCARAEAAPIGRASCRGGVCSDVVITEGRVSFKKKRNT